MGVLAQRAVRVGAAGEREGDDVGPGVGDCPEQDVEGGGGGEEVFGKEGVETVVHAGEGGEVGRNVVAVAVAGAGAVAVAVAVVVALAGGGLEQGGRDLEKEFVRESEERHRGYERTEETIFWRGEC